VEALLLLIWLAHACGWKASQSWSTALLLKKRSDRHIKNAGALFNACVFIYYVYCERKP